METEYSANIIAENMREQCGNEGNHFQLKKEKKVLNSSDSDTEEGEGNIDNDDPDSSE